jgi:hypothetical protein
MPLELLKNNATTTLNGAITNSSGTLVVASASLFPTTPNFRIMIDSEIMLVTAVSGTTFTLTRGFEGTTAASHVDFSRIALIVTSSSIYQYALDRGLRTGIIDQKPAITGSLDIDFDGTPDTLPSGWTWDTTPTGSNTWKLNSRWPSLLTVEGNGNNNYLLSKGFVPGSGDFGIWFKMFYGPSRAFNETSLQFSLCNTAESEQQQWSYLSYNREVNHIWGSKVISSVGSGGFGSVVGVEQHPSNCLMYGGLTRTSANVWSMWYSDNGIAWQQYYNTETHSFTVDHIAVSFNLYTVPTVLGIDWIRNRTDLNFPRL